MTPEELKRSLTKSAPPARCAPALQALWWAAKGDWEAAHKIVMKHDDDADCAWVHAHLHRVEGDLPNARYWYRQAGQPVANGPLETEWESIASTLIASVETR